MNDIKNLEELENKMIIKRLRKYIRKNVPYESVFLVKCGLSSSYFSQIKTIRYVIFMKLDKFIFPKMKHF